MLVENLTQRISVEPVLDADNKVIDRIVLFPGWNETPDKYWEPMRPYLVEGHNSGKYKLYGVSQLKHPLNDESEIKQQQLIDARADMARDMIMNCVNTKNIKTWRSDPKLPSELRALADLQNEKIKRGGVEETDD